ncbi:MAG: hypothetical protein LBB67_02715 [Oscillospiraceae bacterium]|nr:hypothetical protein [Oscillospiraceae bacterium]
MLKSAVADRSRFLRRCSFLRKTEGCKTTEGNRSKFAQAALCTFAVCETNANTATLIKKPISAAVQVLGGVYAIWSL